MVNANILKKMHCIFAGILDVGFSNNLAKSPPHIWFSIAWVVDHNHLSYLKKTIPQANVSVPTWSNYCSNIRHESTMTLRRYCIEDVHIWNPNKVCWISRKDYLTCIIVCKPGISPPHSQQNFTYHRLSRKSNLLRYEATKGHMQHIGNVSSVLRALYFSFKSHNY